EPDSDGPDGDGPDGDEPDGGAPTEGSGHDLAPVDEPTDGEPHGENGVTEQPPASRPPTRHGRAAALHAFWDLTSLLGLTRHCGELSDSGAVLGPATMAELVAAGVAIRRMLLDPTHGHLVDLTPRTWKLPRTKGTDLDAPRPQRPTSNTTSRSAKVAPPPDAA